MLGLSGCRGGRVIPDVFQLHHEALYAFLPGLLV